VTSRPDVAESRPVVEAPTGSTRLGAVIGHPVAHSLSPTIYNAAFATLGLDWVFVAFDVEEGSGTAAVEAMGPLGIDWMSVTMPHKSDAARAVEELSGDAQTLGVANCVVNHDGRLVGHSTDGEGFLRALAAETGFEPAGRACVVLGAGGAARAVALALVRAGSAELVVVNRNRERGEQAAAMAGGAARTGTADDVARADLIVNATPVGMGTDAALPLDPALLQPGQVVADLVYEPAETPLLAAAAARGLTTVNGVGMLVQQAALQFELVMARPAPLDAMRQAARSRLDDP
jgi:shikimate dehydrogenase